MTTTQRIISIAARHLGEGESALAKLALIDAESLAAKDLNLDAERRALDSLAYSVGVHHPDFGRACDAGGHYR